MPANAMRAALACAAFAVLAAAAGATDAIRALPVDEADNDPTFANYRAELLDAVVRQDIDFVVAAAAADIRLSFGGDGGREEFRRMLETGGFAYWDELEEVLRLGGRFTDETTFVAPYTWTYVLPDTADPFTTGFIVGDNVLLRDRPSRFGNVVGSLSYDVVELLGGGQGTDYVEIQTNGGPSGYVHHDYLRYAVDYRAFFERRDGEWLMTLFLAGD